MAFRRILLTSHLIIGAALAPILVLLGITGAILAVQPELEDAANSLLTHVDAGTTPLSPEQLRDRLRAHYPGVTLAEVRFPGRPDRAYEMTLHRPDSADVDLLVNPYNGVVLGSGDDVWSLRPVHDFHTKLLIDSFGSEVTGWGAVGLLFLSLSGMVLWWPGKILSIVRTGSARRILFHLHSALAAYSWIALFAFGVSGVVLHWQTQSYDALASATHAPPIADGSGLQVSTCAADSAAGFDSLLAAASAAEPGAETSFMQEGRRPGTPTRIVMRYPGDRTPAGRTVLYADPCTARVLAGVSTRTAPMAYLMVREWNREVHTGDVGGLPTRVLAFLAALTLPLVAVTGPLLWWSRRKRRAGSQD